MFTQKSNHFNVETIINIHQGTPAEILEFKFRVLCLPETTERKQKKMRNCHAQTKIQRWLVVISSRTLTARC